MYQHNKILHRRKISQKICLRSDAHFVGKLRKSQTTIRLTRLDSTVQQQNEVTVRCNPPVNWRLFGRNKPICTTKGIYTSDKTKQSVQTRIYALSSVKNVVTSCESLQLIYRVTPCNNKSSSRDLKGREKRKQGTQPQH